MRNRRLHVRQCRLRPADGRDVVRFRRGVGDVGVEVDADHVEGLGFAVGGDFQRRAVKEAHPVEVLRGHIGHISAKGVELLLIQRAVARRLGHVLGEDGQFRHAAERIVDFLDIPVLRLAERNGVADIVRGRVNAGQLGV